MRERLSKSLKALALGAVALGMTGTAMAQSAGSTTGTTGSAQVGFERRPQLSLQDELTQADVMMARVEQAATTVRRQLETARQGRDVVKSLCLSDKLSQIDVAGRSGRERQAALQAAVQRKDAELANHEFAIMTVLKQRTEQLGAEANQCIGEEVAFVGQTLVTTTIEGNLPSIDDTNSFPPSLPPVVVAPPVPASGTGQ